jgi:hypothetical protein
MTIIYNSNSNEFKNLVNSYLNNKTIGIIFGNGIGINNISKDILDKIDNNPKILSIGLKRIYLKYEPELILYADDYVDEEYKKAKIKKSKVIKLNKTYAQKYLPNWINTKKFSSIPTNDIWHHRNILMGALHLCYLLNLKTIILVGIDMDNREYFYGKHPKYPNSKQPYETRDVFNYNIYKLINEGLKSLQNDNFIIYYTDESKYLSNISGLIKKSWDNIKF